MSNYQYLAGFFDGEGCISLSRRRQSNKIRIMIKLGNTIREPLRLFQKEFKGNIRYRRPANPNSKDYYNWFCPSSEWIRFITKVIIPYSIIKKERGQIVLSFLETKKTGSSRISIDEEKLRVALYLRVRKLNHRGR